jgi:hypothetical protein
MTLSTSPFPEQSSAARAPETVLGRGRRTRGLSAIPIGETSSLPSSPRQLELPQFPSNPASSPFSGSSSSLTSISAMPVLTGKETEEAIRERLPERSEYQSEAFAEPTPSPSPAAPTLPPLSPQTESPFKKDERARPRRRGPSAATEAEEFQSAFFPMVEEAVQQALYGPRESLQTYLEPMLRQTVRRAIAEQMETAHLFHEVGSIDRLLWHLKALVSSRTYDEIVFDHTKRYQVEELYLFSEDLKWLISYASHDPARHGSPRKVKATVRLLRSRLGALRDEEYSAFDLPEKRLGVLREGKHTVLVAVMRGRANALIRSDLDYLQFQIEERYGRELRDPDNVFLQALQPILEGGLLIQAPPASQ